MGVQGGNPLAALCRQHGVAMHRLSNACPLHDGSAGRLLPPETDAQVHYVVHYVVHYTVHYIVHYVVHCIVHYVVHCIVHCKVRYVPRRPTM